MKPSETAAYVQSIVFTKQRAIATRHRNRTLKRIKDAHDFINNWSTWKGKEAACDAKRAEILSLHKDLKFYEDFLSNLPAPPTTPKDRAKWREVLSKMDVLERNISVWATEANTLEQEWVQQSNWQGQWVGSTKKSPEMLAEHGKRARDLWSKAEKARVELINLAHKHFVPLSGNIWGELEAWGFLLPPLSEEERQLDSMSTNFSAQ